MIYEVTFANGDTTQILIERYETAIVAAKEIVGHRGEIAFVRFLGEGDY